VQKVGSRPPRDVGCACDPMHTYGARMRSKRAPPAHTRLQHHSPRAGDDKALFVRGPPRGPRRAPSTCDPWLAASATMPLTSTRPPLSGVAPLAIETATSSAHPDDDMSHGAVARPVVRGGGDKRGGARSRRGPPWRLDAVAATDTIGRQGAGQGRGTWARGRGSRGERVREGAEALRSRRPRRGRRSRARGSPPCTVGCRPARQSP